MAQCPRCGNQLLENARYCTSCGFEEKITHEIWETPSYREWESSPVDDYWDRPYLTADFLVTHTEIWSKGQFVFIIVAEIMVWSLLVAVLLIAGQWGFALLMSLFFATILAVLYFLYRRGERNLRWGRVLDERIGHTPATVGIIEEPESTMARRRV